MTKQFLMFFAGAAFALHGLAQESDSLSVTLQSGRVIHFETEEQRAKFLAAKARVAAATPTPAAPSVAAALAPPDTQRAAADATPQMNGKVNVNAPTFTADYYLFAPETWEGKQITLSVAYVRRENSNRSDGLVEMRANTYPTQQANALQQHGGYPMIVATPAAAQRIGTLAGT